MTAVASFGTPDRILRFALKDSGQLAEGADPNSEQTAECINRLNELINFLTTVKGLKLWTQLDQSITLVEDQALYTIGPGGTVDMVKPLRIMENGYFLDTSNQKRPIRQISRDEYTLLPTATANSGAITSFFVSKLATALNVYFWLAPDAADATGTAHLILQQQITNFTGVTDTLNFPQEWFIYLHWGLAAELCTGQPQAIVDRCEMKAAMYLTALEDWDVEDAATQFQPDMTRGYGQSSRFR